jgi:hypothetical protein
VLHLYIDANVYLSLYHFATDDLEQINKLSALIKESVIKLYVPAQTLDEVNRNRASVISDALKKLRELRVGEGFPQLARDYEAYPAMRASLRKYDELRTRSSQRLSATL